MGDPITAAVAYFGGKEAKDKQKQEEKQAKAEQTRLRDQAIAAQMADRPESMARRAAESPVASLLQGEAGQPSGTAPMITARAPAKKPTLLGKTSLLGYP